jgi:hypothetical protein
VTARLPTSRKPISFSSPGRPPEQVRAQMQACRALGIGPLLTKFVPSAAVVAMLTERIVQPLRSE